MPSCSTTGMVAAEERLVASITWITWWPAASRRRTCPITASLMEPSPWSTVPSMSRATSHAAMSVSTGAVMLDHREWVTQKTFDDPVSAAL